MGRNQYWAGRVYDLCVYYMTGTPEGSAESGFMEKPGIEPATGLYLTGWNNSFVYKRSKLRHIFLSLNFFILTAYGDPDDKPCSVAYIVC